MSAPVGHHLREGTHEAYLDLRVGLVLLAVHEGFTGFIMTGEAADFMAAVMLPHSLRLTDPVFSWKDGIASSRKWRRR